MPQRPADCAGKAGDQGNPGDRAASLATVEPNQGRKGRIVKPHTEADAEYHPGDDQRRDAVRRGENQQPGGDDQVRCGEEAAPALTIDQPPDRWADHSRQ